MVMNLDVLIDTLRISGFRGIRNLEIAFAPMTVLIGVNNSGKTTVLKALGLALGDYGRYIADEDFYIGDDERKATEIVVDFRIVPVTPEGQRANAFNTDWATEFGDKIKAEANGEQYVAVRTRVSPNEIKGGFQIDRATMERWPDNAAWLAEKIKLTKLNSKFEGLPLFSIEAQRDIHQELKDKYSFVGKVLARVDYDEKEIASLERMIEAVNAEAVGKSKELQRLKDHLTQLNQTFQGAGNAEITPFPKKIRDLSKNFSIHFGETAKSTFAMEYHGMGTRSWASMLTVRAFVDAMRQKHEEEVRPFCAILAAEEPEAHLHPNAQKTLYQQLGEANAQVIVSTHSPYFTAMSDITHIRSLKRTPQGIVATRLEYAISTDDKKILAREILARRGEILFARALILCEGMTEEQVIPAMFEIFSGGPSLFTLGISCISVGGKNNYTPFVKLACSLGIPTFIISDNDGTTKTDVDSQLEKLRKEIKHPLGADMFGLAFCTNPNDFEAELLNVLKLRNEIDEALVLCETNAIGNARYRAAKEAEIRALSDTYILTCMRSAKTSYSGFLSDVLKHNSSKKKPDELIVKAALEAFTTIKRWLKT
jgi:putative ATP-dependent endonuclease of OLD family